MPIWFTSEQYEVVEAMCARLIPTDEQPGATEARVVDYIDGLLGAFLFDPPRIWAGAGGAVTGRSDANPMPFATFHRLNSRDELAWRTRIEGSLGIPEREFNGPVEGLQTRYREGLAAIGSDFARVPPDEQDERLRAHRDFTALVHEHACEGMYGAPEYGGNRGLVGWTPVHWQGDTQPRGFTPDQVSGPDPSSSSSLTAIAAGDATALLRQFLGAFGARRGTTLGPATRNAWANRR